MEDILVFDSFEEADEYAHKNTDAHQRNQPIILTPYLLQALNDGKAVVIGVNWWEYAEILITKK